MSSDDRSRPRPEDVLAAIGLLTRLPIPLDLARSTARGAACAWAWPLAGALVGAFGAGAAALVIWFGVSAHIAAALALGAQTIVTGALHEDGLADSADGLWGGWDKAKRLAIMKDSHIGTYGVLALLIVSLIRWSALTQLLSSGSIWPALIAAGALSRTPMAIVMAALPNARGSGLSQSVGRPAVSTVVGAITVSLVVAGFAVGHALVATLFPLAVTTFVVMSVARRRIGGQTGDILGASQQLGDAAILVTLATTLT